MSTSSSSTSRLLPDPNPDQKYVTVSAFPAGFITLPEKAFIYPADPDARRTVPSLAFLVTHPGGGVSPLLGPDDSPPSSASSASSDSAKSSAGPFRLMFDLGLRANPEKYIPELGEHLASRQPVIHRPSVKETLEKGGVPAEEIDAVVISHVHWDHHGDPEDFPNARFLIGPGAAGVLEHGMPGRGAHSHFDARLFEKCPQGVAELAQPTSSLSASTSASNTKLALPTTKEVEWNPLGPFPQALDIFADGSVYLLNAPGHLPGHINLLCRTGPHNWIYLGGDAYHDKRLLTGEREIAEWNDPSGSGAVFCFHIDKASAMQTIQRIRDLIAGGVEGGYEVEVVVAHDDGWLEENQARLFPEVL